jgi:hypothetical protein
MNRCPKFLSARLLSKVKTHMQDAQNLLSAPYVGRSTVLRSWMVTLLISLLALVLSCSGSSDGDSPVAKPQETNVEGQTGGTANRVRPSPQGTPIDGPAKRQVAE